ncbi:serrate RNA effector molecule homolog [Telopea speciosissima]|uniref:serrate RNA effector molecule homolog n=1 Tax=Telopea speciosissima TaxID=54955 RepID=UPI001CC3D327|nr:serrate RNA effector molecule homolog [Telopea speciosissima]XP_043702605.1 serrate RNA effector molecule homolog [Telopea speciosissima]XP_043702606.1 serrate RNA effector molecule homolog [Telopea speciosissima]
MEVSFENGASNGEAKRKQKLQEEAEVVQDIEIAGELKPEDSEVIEDIQVARELRPDKDVNIEESVGPDAGSSSSSSSSSSSNEESRLEDKNSGVMESEKMEEEEKSGGSVKETVPVVYSAEELVEEKSANSVMDTVPNVDLAEKLEEAEKKSDGSVMEAAPAVDSCEPVVSLIEEVIQASVSTTVVDAGVSNKIGLESKDKEEISLPLSNEAAEASDLIDSTATKNEDRMLQYSDAPIIETSGSGSAELPKEPAIPESSENQPLLGAIPPPPVERTSWNSCCGIFDVLRGTDR